MDIANRITTIFRSETGSAEAAVRRLRGVERDRAKEVLHNLNAENSKLEDSIARWAKIGVAIGGVVVAYKGLISSSKAYLEDVRLEAAATGANIEALTKATHGLVEEDNLLAFAGDTLRGKWRLNQREMETVLRGAMALRKQFGVELEPTIQALGESISKGATRALKEFGIEATSKAGLLRELDKRAQETGGSFTLAGDDMIRAGTSVKDALDRLQGAIGRVVVNLAPMIEAIGTLINKLMDLGDVMSDRIVSSATNTGPVVAQLSKQQQAWRLLAGLSDEQRNVIASTGSSTLFGGAGIPAFRQIQALGFTGEDIAEMAKVDKRGLEQSIEGASREINRSLVTQVTQSVQDINVAIIDGATSQAIVTIEQVLKNLPARTKAKGAKPGKPGAAGGDPIDAVRAIIDTLSVAGGNVAAAAVDPRTRGWRPISDEVDAGARFAQDMQGLSNGVEQAVAAARAAQAEFQGRFLESVFGPVDQFNVYAQGFQMFTGAAGAAFDAWITGADSMAGAAKKFVAEALRGVANQMLVESLKHAAFALGSLAFLDARGAATHGAAAAAFGAGAIAAGAIARQMGAGQTAARPGLGAGSAVAGGAGAAAPTAPAGDGGKHITIVLGRDFLDLPDLEQRRLTYAAIQRASAQGVTTANVRRQ
jgi:hypothetical protein